MSKKERWHWSPLVSFFLVGLGGGFVATAVFRHFEVSPSGDQEMLQWNEMHKLYLESRTESSRWIFNIAFTLLGALLGLQVSEKARIRLRGHTPLVACGFLFVSLYSAFLYQIGLSEVLGGFLWRMHGPLLDLPVAFQFWSLLIAVALLAIFLYKESPKGTQVLIVLIAGLLSAVPATAASTEIGSADPCLQSWQNSRKVKLEIESRRDIQEVVLWLEKRQDLHLEGEARCDFVMASLDQIRSAAIENGSSGTGEDAGKAISALLHSAAEATRLPTFDQGSLLDQLLNILEIWHASSGVLTILSEGATFFVYVVDTVHPNLEWRGRTPLLLRLPPGIYQVSCSAGGTSRPGRKITVKSGTRLGFPC